MKKNVKKLPKSQVSIEVSIPQETFESYRPKALGNLGEHVGIAGFRKGKAPAQVLEKEIKPLHLLEEMAELCINEHLPKILLEEKIDAIGRPQIQITKIAAGNPFEFTATVAILPEVTLPDYTKIAIKEPLEEPSTDVSEEELTKAIIELKKARKHQQLHDEKIQHDHDAVEKEDIDASLTDEYVRELGPFESVDAFKEKFKENIAAEKSARAREKRRVAILEKIYSETKIELPELLIQNELETLIARLKGDISQAGLSFEDYLTHIQKTEEIIRTDMLPDAEKRATMELIMHTIAQQEKLIPKEEEINRETERLMTVYKDVDIQRARAYVTQLLANEEVFRFLESQK